MKKFKNILYEFIRNELKKEFTGNLGKVIEEDNKIICYVNKNKYRKQKLSHINCYGINENNKVLANSYKLNKKIVYVFENLEIEDKKVAIHGYNNCNIIIKNCKFNMGLHLSNYGECTIDDTYINGIDLVMLDANKFNIRNSEIQNKYYYIGEKLVILIGSDEKLNITNSKIGRSHEKVELSLSDTKEINISNSKIESSDISINAPIFKSDENSSISGSNKISIDSDKIEISKLKSQSLIINDEKVMHPFNEYSLNSEISNIESKRFKLIKLLKKLKNECNELISTDINKFEKNLYNEQVSKRLNK